jgi:hypothetical protein
MLIRRRTGWAEREGRQHDSSRRRRPRCPSNLVRDGSARNRASVWCTATCLRPRLPCRGHRPCFRLNDAVDLETVRDDLAGVVYQPWSRAPASTSGRMIRDECTWT